ncbi:Pept_C1 domain-containing protein [Candidatus Nitrotoga sp. HW29]|uniref:C1 family peptidase n=1 Tax=Candidatus Nitrotoga sp. HW29 TaxID=2886963 RepID=UPI001EF28C5D|nr:C1 family peptidase [Candidatus Nitrotoga sp. HW29]CAH1905536.1 Pept_C1 domain-containing protein [Candidatus Nitrotoga sp. HW29]
MVKKRVPTQAPQSVAAVAKESAPKTTRPESESRRIAPDERSVAQKISRTLDAFPDKIDLKDWEYLPTLQALPDEIVNIHAVPAILDQRTEGACTGFALAAVINFLLHQRKLKRLISPRMIYELARRYDEWPGENYSGSSARGAMKGWERHGVCTQKRWPDHLHGADNFNQKRADEAIMTPGGAYYRVDFRQVRHVHAAIHEVGIVYATLMVHAGWGQPGPSTISLKTGTTRKPQKIKVPVIQRKGNADGGHAIALVGYTTQGFIIQNSWGTRWGNNGFALLPYEDFMIHATDVWVAQLGVPVKADLWAQGAADVTSGKFRAGQVIPLNEIRPYVIDVGNNGKLSDQGNYWTTEEDLKRLLLETIPAKTKDWAKRRVMLYIHGGLNSEEDVAKRIIAFRDVCLANEIYPLHIMWESDWFNTAKNILKDQFTAADQRAGGVFLDHLREAKDRVLELTLAAPGGKLWGEMVQNAELASKHATGAMQLLTKYAKEAKESLGKKAEGDWELHVVGHSAGSIFAAHAITQLASLGISWKTLQFMAPAIRIDLFKEIVLPKIIDKTCPKPSLYNLSKVGELDDDVGPYGKSLLYLVSNAFEGAREVPLLGMQKFLEKDPELLNLLNSPVDGLPGIVISGAGDQPGAISKSETHGGFDNDPNTMNSVLVRILGKLPKVSFTARDLHF